LRINGGDLPAEYVSTAATTHDDPVFTPMLVEGLRLHVKEFDTSDPWQGWKQMAEYASLLKINSKTIQRALKDLIRRGIARRTG